MADIGFQPFVDLVTGKGNPPMNQQTQELNKGLIEQLSGRYQADHMPNPGGPYGWMGAAADMGKIISTPILANAYRRAQDQINTGFADSARNARYNMDSGSAQPQPQGQGTPVGPPQVPTASSTEGTNGPPSYKDIVKAFENRDLALGKTTSSKASWDYKQYTNGFGTKATSPNEVIDAPTAHARFDAEWNKAAQLVAAFPGGQNLDSGTKAALTSLTFNSGTQWMQSGLGQAIQNGDIETARKLFLQYNRAGGKENEGLKARREREAMWFGQPDPSEQAQIDPTGRMNATAPGGPQPPELPPTGETKAAAPTGAPTAAPAAAPDATPGTEETPPGATPPVRLAQAGGPTPGQGSPNAFAGPGNGIAAPNLENSKQFHDLMLAYLRMGVPPQQAMEYVQDIIKRSGTQMLKGPMGDVPFTNRPQDQGGPTLGQPMPQIGERQAVHINIHGIQVPFVPWGTNEKGEPVYKSAVGGLAGGDKPMTISELAEYGRQQAALDTGTAENAKNMAEMRTKIMDEGSGDTAGTAKVEANKMLALSKAYSMEHGPTAAWATRAREFFSNLRSEEKEALGITPDYINRAKANELAQKLNTTMAFTLAKTLNTNRITNLSLQEALIANPNAMQTKEGMESLLDLIIQDMDRKMGLAKEIGDLPTYRNNEIPNISRKYMEDHPAIMHDKDKGDLYMRDYKGAEDAAGKLPPGSRFMYEGKIRRVKDPAIRKELREGGTVPRFNIGP